MITVGDNLYGGERPQDFKQKFEDPYKPLLDAGVKFYASLGNHDDRAQARIHAVQHGRQDVLHVQGAEAGRPVLRARNRLPAPAADHVARTGARQSRTRNWKIPYFHHPLYSSGDRHGSDLPTLREVLEPLFVKNDVSVVFAGHDHFYERIKPQKGIVYFVTGSGGQLRKGNIDQRTRSDGRRLRHRPGIPGGRDQRRRALLQRDLAHRRRSSTPASSTRPEAATLARFLHCGLVLRPPPRGRRSPAQSVSNTACIFFAIRASVTMTPTSRRPSSSSLRRLWLPTNAVGAVADDRADVQAQARQLARLDAGDRPCPTLPIIRISTPAFARSAAAARSISRSLTFAS